MKSQNKLLLLLAMLIFAIYPQIPLEAQVKFSEEEEVKSSLIPKNLLDQNESITYEGRVGPGYGRFRSIAFDPANEGVAYASNRDRQLFKSTDHGQTWSYLYSAPRVPGFPVRITDLRFANPQEPTHLYFVVGDGSSSDVDTRGIYIMDVTTGEIIDTISTFYIHHLNFADYDVDPLNPDNIVVLGAMGIWFDGSRRTVWKSTNGGEDFDLIFDYINFNELSPRTVTIDPGNPNGILLGMGGSPGDDEGGFYGTIDGGDNWNRITAGDIINEVVMDPANSDRLFAITGFGAEENKILHSTNGGFTWNSLDYGIDEDLIGNFIALRLDHNDPDKVWVTSTERIHVSTDGGQNWESTLFDEDTYHTYRYGASIDVNPFNSQHVIVGSDHRVVQTMDGGDEWSVMPIYMMNLRNVDPVKLPDGSEYLYYTANGSYLAHNLETHEVNGHLGLNMVNQSFQIYGDQYSQDRAFIGVPMFMGGVKIFKSDRHLEADPVEVFDGSGRVLSQIIRCPEDTETYWFIIPQTPNWQGPAKLYRTTDDFETIEELSITKEQEVITDIEVVEGQPGVIWAYAASNNDTGVFKSTDYGDTWISYSTGLPEDIGIWNLSVNQNNPDNILATVSMNQGLYVTFDGGENWVSSFYEFECTDVVFSKAHENIAFARRFGVAGGVFSEDGGASWSVVPEEVGLDANYNRMGIIDQDETIDIYMSGSGVSIVKYTYTVPEQFDLAFNIQDEEGQEITDATITLDGVEYEAGIYVFEDLDPGTYSYMVNREGYQTFEDEVTITDADVVVNVTLLEEEEPVFTVTFYIEDEEGDVITEAMVTFDGTQYGPGVYVFEEIEAGTYDYLVTKEGYHEESGEVSVTDEDVVVEVTLERDDVSLSDPDLVELSIFPNPASTEINVRSEDKIQEIRIFDMLGQQVYAAEVQSNTYQVNVAMLDKGIYFLRINTLKGFATEKLQIIK